MDYTIEHSCKEGVERIVYRPLEKRFEETAVAIHNWLQKQSLP